MTEEEKNNQEMAENSVEENASALEQESTAHASADKECQEQLDVWKERYLRSVADFENFKKRVDKDRGLWARGAQLEMLRSLLSVVDNFDRALSEQGRIERTPENEAWLKGFELVSQALSKFLEQFDVKAMEDITTFDPSLHEALVQVDAQDKEAGAIVDVLEKGYTFKGDILRPAKVSVAK